MPSSTSTGSYPRSVPVFTLVLTALIGVGLVPLAVRSASLGAAVAARPAVVAGVFVALVVAATLNLEYHYRGQIDAFDHFEIALALALALFPGTLVVVLTVAAKAASQLLRRVDRQKLAFNVAQWTLAATAGALVATAFGLPRPNPQPTDLPVLALALLVVLLVNVAAMTLVLGLLQRRPPRRWFAVSAPALLRETLVPVAVNVTFALLFVATYSWAPQVAPLLLVPLALLHYASRGSVVGAVQQARLDVAQRATAALAASADSPAGIAGFLAELGRGLDRQEAVLFLQTPAGAQSYAWRDPRPDRNGVAQAEPFELVRALARLGGATRVDGRVGDDALRELLAATGRRDALAAPVPRADSQPDVLCLFDARRPVAFPQRELPVLATLAEVVGAALDRDSARRAAAEQQAELSRIVEETSDGVATIGPDGGVRTWNRAFAEITGCDQAQITGGPGLAVLEPTDGNGMVITLADWARRTVVLPSELQIRRSTGERRWLSCSYTSVAATVDEPARLIVMARDATELRQAQSLLADQAAVLELIARGAPLRHTLGVLAAKVRALDDDASCAILLRDRGNEARLELLAADGVDTDALAALDCFSIGPDAGWTGRAVYHRHAITVEDVERGIEPVRDAALVRGIHACWAMPVTDPNAGLVIGVVAVFFARRRGRRAGDWSSLERAAHLTAIAVARADFEDRLAHQTTHDALTDLPNRVAFLDRCEHALQSSAREGRLVVVLFLDLDGFKVVNDSMGHDAGDRLLVAVAERLQGVLRPADTVARFGGDEFTILCERVPDLTYVGQLADRVHAALKAPFRLETHDVFIRASIGIAVSDRRSTPGELLSNADAAMYRAKRRGGDRHVIFDPQMRGPALLRLATETDLHRALERSEFLLAYQPTFALATGQVTGAEVLLRWRHPRRGLLLPESFLPLAESTGLIVPISAYVFAESCRQAKRWRRTRPDEPFTLNVNLSPRQLAQPGLADAIGRLVVDSSVPANSICLEVTESVLMDDIDTSTSVLRQLKDLGLRIAIDDFGTGYSSLSHLKRFPVDWLKVDRSFVLGMEHDHDDRAIVSAVINLAHSLNLSTIAEGVETAGQLVQLRELGCEAAQGFYLARPLSADELLHTPAVVPLPGNGAVSARR